MPGLIAPTTRSGWSAERIPGRAADRADADCASAWERHCRFCLIAIATVLKLTPIGSGRAPTSYLCTGRKGPAERRRCWSSDPGTPLTLLSLLA
jgi:hypothetical protein